MLRPSTIFVFALAALLLAASTGCSAATVSSREVNSPNDLARGASLLVGPGPLDVGNVYLPAVMVSTTIPDSQGSSAVRPCSGVLIHPRIVVTAGHCVCLPRAPAPEDELSGEKSTKPVRVPALTRARALQDVFITAVTDKRSSCAQVATVTTLVYEPSKPEEVQSARIADHQGAVMLHPEFELIAGTKQGRTEIVWNNADLAVIVLEKPVRFDSRPVVLTDSEVKLGDAVVMVGYGPGESSKPYGSRQFGENKVTRLVNLETGSVVFGAAVPPGPDSTAPAHAGPGDSGGACVRRGNANILVGIITMGAQTAAGTKMSLFTSIYPHKHWLSQIVRRINRA